MNVFLLILLKIANSHSHHSRLWSQFCSQEPYYLRALPSCWCRCPDHHRHQSTKLTSASSNSDPPSLHPSLYPPAPLSYNSTLWTSCPSPHHPHCRRVSPDHLVSWAAVIFYCSRSLYFSEELTSPLTSSECLVPSSSSFVVVLLVLKWVHRPLYPWFWTLVGGIGCGTRFTRWLQLASSAGRALTQSWRARSVSSLHFRFKRPKVSIFKFRALFASKLSFVAVFADPTPFTHESYLSFSASQRSAPSNYECGPWLRKWSKSGHGSPHLRPWGKAKSLRCMSGSPTRHRIHTGAPFWVSPADNRNTYRWASGVSLFLGLLSSAALINQKLGPSRDNQPSDQSRESWSSCTHRTCCCRPCPSDLNLWWNPSIV